MIVSHRSDPLHRSSRLKATGNLLHTSLRRVAGTYRGDLAIGPRRVVAYSHLGDEDLHEARLGPNVLSNVKELRDPSAIAWVTATVTRSE